MRTLAASVLAFEAVVVGLSIPVAIAVTDVPAAGAGAALGLLAVACLVTAGLLGRRWAYGVGWVLQGLIVASGLVVPAMAVLGLVFGVLWWCALHFGAKAERIRAAAGPGPSAG